MGPRGCSFSGHSQPGDIHAAFDVCQVEAAIIGPPVCMLTRYRFRGASTWRSGSG